MAGNYVGDKPYETEYIELVNAAGDDCNWITLNSKQKYIVAKWFFNNFHLVTLCQILCVFFIFSYDKHVISCIIRYI